jgi:hypothetical protein
MSLPPGVSLENNDVVLDGVDPHLLSLVAHLGMLHKLAFGEDMVVVFGRGDRAGAPYYSQLHQFGRAVAILTRDLEHAGLALLVHCVAFTADVQPIAYRDDRPNGLLIIEWWGA